jgi:tripartite-type tricarboxylate transporter receptor subunit TctC
LKELGSNEVGRHRHTRRAILAAATFLVAASGQAETAGEFYAKQPLRIIIGYGPGSGYDTYGRLLSRHLGRFLPGNPSVVVQNMPGAGAITAANHLYSVAAKDGSAIGLVASSALLEPVYGREGARFDPAQFTWIGNMDESIGTCSVWHTSGIERLEDLKTKEAVFGGSGPAGVNSQHAAALKNLLRLNIKLVQGYPGATEVKLAIVKGELHGGCGFALSSLKSAHGHEFRSGQLRPIIQLGLEKHPELEGVPHVYDYAKSDEDRQVFDLVFGSHVLGRPVLAPPGIPEDRKLALRKAFMETMVDPAFQAEADKLNLPIKPTDGAGVERFFVRFLGAPKTVVQRASAAMRE